MAMGSRSLGIAATIASALVSGILLSGAARADTVDYRTLPEASIGSVPKRAGRPEQLGAGRVAGIFLVPPPRNEYSDMNGLSQAYLFSSETQAEDMWGKNVFARVMHTPSKPPQGCFLVHEYYSHDQRDDVAWQPRFQRMGVIQGARTGTKAAHLYSYYAGTQAVRWETLAVADGTATLTAVEAWADAVSQGMKLIRTRKATFKKVAEAPGGVSIYAARDPDGEQIHFLLQRTLEERGPVSNSWILQSGTDSGNSDCGHAHLSLRAVPGMGDTASVRMDLPLAVTPIEDANTRENPPAPGQARMNEVRMRALKVHLSLSRTAGDDAPLPSVSWGWDAAEQRSQAFL
jgi:hypothetical protein